MNVIQGSARCPAHACAPHEPGPTARSSRWSGRREGVGEHRLQDQADGQRVQRDPEHDRHAREPVDRVCGGSAEPTPISREATRA